MDQQMMAAVIGSLVGAIFGGAVATIGGIWPLRRELAEFKLSITERVAILQVKEETTARAVRLIGRQATERFDSVLIAMGRRDLVSERPIETDEDS